MISTPLNDIRNLTECCEPGMTKKSRDIDPFLIELNPVRIT